MTTPSGSDRFPDAGERLSAAETRALAALLAGADQESAAKAARRTARTIRRMLRTPRFVAARAAASREILAGAIQSLQAGAARAAEALVAMAAATTQATSARVAACRSVIELGRDLGEIDQLRDAVADLSDRLKNRGGLVS